MNRLQGALARPQDLASRLPGFAVLRKRRQAPAAIWITVIALLGFTVASLRAQSSFSSLPVGSTSGAQNVTVTSAPGGTVSSVRVLTLGASNLDFAKGAGASTCETATLAPGGNCTESVTFTPSLPGLRIGAVVLLSSGGQVLGTGYISGTGLGGLGVLLPGNMTTVAGVLDLYTSVGDGGPATLAELDLPAAVAIDGAGNLYIADSLHNRIRIVCSSTPPPYVTGCTGAGTITSIVGNGDPSYTGDGGLASSATLSSPDGLAIDGAGNIYIADTGNNVIRKITAATGMIATIAGNNSGTVCGGSTDSVGDGCTATQAVFNQPWGVTLDKTGNIYIADTSNHRIREVSATTFQITTIAGNGYTAANGNGKYSGDGGLATAASLNFPHAVAFDASGNMYIPDTLNDAVREVTAIGGAITPISTINTFAGTGTSGSLGCNAAAAAANTTPLHTPSAVTVDAAGNVYIADTENNAVRKVIASTGDMETVIQSGCEQAYNGSGFQSAALYAPMSMALDGNGNLYIADYFEMVVRQVQGNLAVLNFTTPATRQGSQSTPVSQAIENDGNAPLDITSITAGTNSTLGSASSCAPGNLAADSFCTISAIFSPTVAGNGVTGNIDVAADTASNITAANSPLDIELIGNSTAVNSTTTAVTSNPATSVFGQLVTFTVTVTTGAGTGNLTGTVSLADTFGGSTNILAQALTLNLSTSGTTMTGTATFTISTLGIGKHSIVAAYNNSNDASHFPSTSAAITQTVLESVSAKVVSTVNPSTVGQSVTFNATVSISGGGGVVPDGSVTFMDGNTPLSVQTLTASGLNGVASYTTSTLANGPHSITVIYSGDAANQINGTTSAILTQDVQAPAAITLTSNQNAAFYGSPVTLTATIASSATNAATGTVTFLDAGKSIGTGTLSGTPATASLTLSTLSVGTHPITATYPGDGYNAAATSGAPLNQVIAQTLTSTTVAATPNPGIAGGATAITATVKVTAGAATPGGTLTFNSGTTLLGSAAIKGNTGQATINPVLVPNTYSIVATYTGDTDDAGSNSSPFSLVVVQATTSTTVSVAPSPGIVTQPITFTAMVTGTGLTPTGAVNFLANGSPIGSGNLNTAGIATLTTSSLPVGSYTITAQYLGDVYNAGSTAPSISESVSTLATLTDLGSATTTGTNPQVLLVATVINSAYPGGPVPTGSVTFTSGTTQIGAANVDSSGVATLVPNLAGGVSYNITANYLGDSDHAPSSSSATSILNTPKDFTVTFTPATVTLASSQNTTVVVNLTSTGGFTDSITIGCGSTTVWVTCIFSPATVTLPANGVASTKLTIDTNSPLSGGLSASNRASSSRGITLAGLLPGLLPFSALFGWLLWRFRRRYASVLTVVLTTGLFAAVSAAALLMNGCGGISLESAPPGTYVIQVTGTGVNSNVISYGTLTVTVTK